MKTRNRSTSPTAPERADSRCRICGEPVRGCLDFGRQPVSQAFPRSASEDETFFRLEVGVCSGCGMVQQLHEVPREAMFRSDYPYRSSESAAMREHFRGAAEQLLRGELAGGDPFAVEIGSNDGIMLRTISGAGVRHLGVDPSEGAAEAARAHGVRIRVGFFEERSAAAVRRADGPADVIYSANTISHVSDIGSIFRGVGTLLGPAGVFVFEDRYLGDIVANTYFDQIYDEHFYLFAADSVRALAARFGLELVDAERLSVHGGSIRYTVARPGARPRSDRLRELLAEERLRGLGEPRPLLGLAENMGRTGDELTSLLRGLRAAGRRIAGYGATAKSATVLNHCAIGPELIECVYDSTPGKDGLLTPGTHVPIRLSDGFAEPYPDYAVLFAWNHAEEIMAKERRFTEQGGRWILYVPAVRVIP